jgi:hypothetical protein
MKEYNSLREQMPAHWHGRQAVLRTGMYALAREKQNEKKNDLERNPQACT